MSSKVAEEDLKVEIQHLESLGAVAVVECDNSLDKGETSVSLRTCLAILGLTMTMGFQLGIGSVMIPSVLANIAEDFGPQAVALQAWISSGWLLAQVVAFVISGRLSDIFGRRLLITGSNLGAIAGFAMCAFTSSFSVFVGGIIVLGFFAGLAHTSTAGACEIVPNKYRPITIAVLEMGIAPLGFMTGSTFAHLFVAYSTWRWIPRLGIICCGLAFCVCFAFYNPPAIKLADGVTRMQLFRQLDHIGIFLFSSGLGVFLMGVIWAGGQYPAKDLHVILPIPIGIVVLGVFVAWQIRQGDRAVIPLRLFKGKTRTFTLPIIVHFVAGSVFFGQIALWPLQSAFFYAKDLTAVGVLGLPPGFAVFVGGCIIGPFIPKLGPTNRQLQVAIIFMVSATASMAALTPTSKTAAIICVVLANVPFHIIVNLCFLTVQFAQSHEDMGIAVGLCGACRSLGGTIGVSVYLTILSSRIPATVPSAIIAAAVRNAVPESSFAPLVPFVMSHDASSARQLSGVNADVFARLTEAMNLGYASCFKVVYLSTLGFGVIGIIAAFFVADVSPRFTSHTDVVLEKPKGDIVA